MGEAEGFPGADISLRPGPGSAPLLLSSELLLLALHCYGRTCALYCARYAWLCAHASHSLSCMTPSINHVGPSCMHLMYESRC